MLPSPPAGTTNCMCGKKPEQNRLDGESLSYSLWKIDKSKGRHFWVDHFSNFPFGGIWSRSLEGQNHLWKFSHVVPMNLEMNEPSNELLNVKSSFDEDSLKFSMNFVNLEMLSPGWRPPWLPATSLFELWAPRCFFCASYDIIINPIKT